MEGLREGSRLAWRQERKKRNRRRDKGEAVRKAAEVGLEVESA